MAENDVILRSARFDPRLVTYFHIQSLIVLTFTFIGLPLVPIWIFVGRAFHQKQVDRMECHLTPRALLVRYGLLVRVQKSIPLDKVTDMDWDPAKEDYDYRNDPERTRLPEPPVHCSGCHR